MRLVAHRVCRVEDVPCGTGRIVSVPGEGDVLVCRTEAGTVNVVGAHCPHLNERLDRGRIEGGEVVCRRHQLRFDLATGRCVNAAGYELKRYAVAEIEGDVVVSIWTG